MGRKVSDFSKMVFQEVTKPKKLFGITSSTDADWNIVSSPMMPIGRGYF